MKLKKVLATLIAVLGLITAINIQSQTVHAESINSLAQKYKYSGVTYLYKMLKLEGIKYNKFPGVEYENDKPEGIVVHETDDPGATAHDEAIYFNREWMNINAYVHAFVDSKQVIQMRSPDMGTWGAGPKANNRFIRLSFVKKILGMHLLSQ